jgi:peptide chain release factor 2
LPRKQARVSELESILAQPGVWDDQERAQKLNRERSKHEDVIAVLGKLARTLDDADVLLELGVEAGDDSVEGELEALMAGARAELQKMEFRRMMSGPYDHMNAIVDVTAGAGGTDAQDWAEMLLRMYTRWCTRSGFELEEVDLQPGEAAGIKGATFIVRGEWAYGWLRAEDGVHRLVRISPFDAEKRRQTAFAAVRVTPELDDEVKFEVDWAKDVREDRLRSGGAGGQHVNKTESAIRLTHLPTGIVVISQSERSQHKNRSTAQKILMARLHAYYEAQQQAEREKLSNEKLKIEFGAQIRSYVNHPYRMVKDHRTEHETSNYDAVIDGDLDGFMEAFLLAAAGQKRPDGQTTAED